MSILCALVAYGPKILTEHSIDSTQNFSKASSAILSKIRPGNSRLTYAADDCLFHYIKADDVVFMCVAQETLGRKIPFTLLTDLQHKFFSTYASLDLSSMPPYGLKSFTTELVSLLTSYNSSSSSDPNQPQQSSSSNNNTQPIHIARSELANVKDIMIKNVGEILNRGERIELLLDKTDHLSAQSNAFRKRSQNLRRKMWWKNTKMIALSVVLVIMVIYILIAEACGPSLSHCST